MAQNLTTKQDHWQPRTFSKYTFSSQVCNKKASGVHRNLAIIGWMLLCLPPLLVFQTWMDSGAEKMWEITILFQGKN